MEERLFLLDLIEEILPIGQPQWDDVASRYAAQFPREGGRNADALRKVFKRLSSSTKPTGDPNCPLDIKRAKRINRMIVERSHLHTMGDSDVEPQPNVAV